MKTSITITKLILLALLLVSNVMSAQNQSINVNGTQIQVSSNLQTVLDQAETVYAIPSNFTFNEVYNKAPTAVPFFLGLIMQRQDIMMKEIRNIEHLNNSNVLEDEIMAFLSQLAQAHNNHDPVNNTSMIAAKLQVYYYEALKGNQNDNSKNNFGIDPTTVNIAYLLDRPPSTNNNTGNTGEHAALILADDAPTEINLFGHVSDPADEFKKGHVDKKEWDPSKSFSSDVILGAWYYKPSCQKVNMVFSRGENGYSAITNNNEYSYQKWKVIRVKGNWDKPEEKMYWNEHYKATIQTIMKEDGSVKYTRTMTFYIHPYRDKMVLSEYYQPTGITWTIYKPF